MAARLKFYRTGARFVKFSPMERMLIDGLIQYIGLVILLTFHEFGHAWMALKCGDTTARDEGRVSLNPLVHLDVVGTVIIPLLMIFLSASGSELSRFLVGWARPVPVNPMNLRNPKVDDILVTLAGPWMNVLLAIVLVALARLGVELHSVSVQELCIGMAQLSLLLCFFNLIPIPPLDGSHVVRIALGMSYEAYFAMARYGMVILIIVLQIPIVRSLLATVTNNSLYFLAERFGAWG